ncbi:MAG: HAD family phosphatase [Lascolabacillus sp.]|nr:HAD family phosphatase [Lascolabacillus sp.]
MKHLKNIVFDFGGVLIDWNPVYLYKKVFDSEEQMSYFLENICSSEWNIQQDKGRPLSEATELLKKKHPEYKNEIEMYYGRWTEMLGGLFEENVKLIKPLKEKYKVYGLTNWSAETIPHAMERYGFFKDLDGIVVSGEEKLIKPDSRIYQTLLDRFDIKAEETLFIDDNHTNVEAALNMNFKVVHLTEDLNLEKWLKDNEIMP